MERRKETMERKILMWKRRAVEFQMSALDVKTVTGTTIQDANNACISSHIRDVTELNIILSSTIRYLLVNCSVSGFTERMHSMH